MSAASFDQGAFADTAHQITRDLEHVANAVAWLAPAAYEHRAGGGGGHNVICGTCEGVGRHCGMVDRQCATTGPRPPESEFWPCRCNDQARATHCQECVVAVIGDVGEIVVRRGDYVRLLDEFARDLDRIWDLVKGMHGRVRKLEALIDRGATLEGIGPPTVDPSEVLSLVKAREARVRRGEELPPDPHAASEAKSTLRSAVRTQQAIDAAAARRESGGSGGGNRWRK